jgi:outer membrane lipoprotein SlyB
MANVKAVCDGCTEEFNPKKNAASKRAITLSGAGTGAMAGSSVGIAAGPLGAIAGTGPGAVVGAMAGHFVDRKWVKCPHCDETQLL